MPRYIPTVLSLVVALVIPSCGPPADAGACYVQHGTFNSALAAPSQMFVANNQQWCSVIFHSVAPGAAPYQSGSFTRLPAHGQARVSTGPSGVVFWYRPAPQFVGSDEFQVEYGSGQQTVQVTVRDPQANPPKPAIAEAAPPPSVVATNSSSTIRSDAPKPMPLSTGERISFRCLPSGTEQTYSGVTVKWLGYDPSSSDLCIGRNKEGQPVQRVKGVWPTGGIWPDALSSVRQAFTRLETEPPGTPISFTVTAKAANSQDPRPGSWTHTAVIAGVEPITVPAGTFDAVMIEDTEQGMNGTYRGVNRIWVDRSSGAVLRWETTGISNGQHSSRETTSLRLP